MSYTVTNRPKFFERSKCLARDGATVTVSGADGGSEENLLSFSKHSAYISTNGEGPANTVTIYITLPENTEINRLFLLNHNLLDLQIAWQVDGGAMTGFTNIYSTKLTCVAANTTNSTGTSVKDGTTGITGVYPDESQEGQLIKERYYWLTALDANTLKVEWSWTINGLRTTVGNFDLTNDTDTSITGTGLKVTGGSAVNLTAGDVAYCLPTRPADTGVIEETDNTRSNSYFEFDAVTVDTIRILCRKTFPDDTEQKIIEQVIATKEYENSPLDYPCSKMPINLDQNEKTLRHYGNGRVNNVKGNEHFSCTLDYTQAMNPSDNDLEMFETLWRLRTSFIVWPSGGFENHRIRALSGHRPCDVYNVTTIGNYESEYYKNLYNSGGVVRLDLEESV